jgi:hypothetical protein
VAATTSWPTRTWAGQKILASADIRRLIDFGQPTGLLLVAVLHFVADTEDPWRVVATLRDALAPGSYLVLGHGTDENDHARARAAEKLCNRSVSTSAYARSRAGILRFFDGFDLVDPGLVYAPCGGRTRPRTCPATPAGSET